MTLQNGINLASNKILDANEVTAKGQVFAGTGVGTYSLLNVGADGQVLTADSTQATGLKWSVGGSGSGDVVGPTGGAGDRNIPLFDGIDGKLLSDSGINVDTSGNMVVAGGIESQGTYAYFAGPATFAEQSTFQKNLKVLFGGLTVNEDSVFTGNLQVTGQILTPDLNVADVQCSNTINALSTITSPNIPAYTAAGQLVVGVATGQGDLLAPGSDGDVLTFDSTATPTLLKWATPAPSGGDVSSSVSSATDNAVVRMDSTTGKLIQSSSVIVSDAGAISGLTGVSSTTGTFSGALSAGSISTTGTAATGALTVTGTTTSTGSVINGSQQVKRTATSTAYTALTSDYIIAVTGNSAAVTITLPTSPLAGQLFVVKDEGGQALTYNITVSSTLTIDGATTQVINNSYGSLTIYYNGTSYSII